MGKRLRVQGSKGYVKKWKKDSKKNQDKISICYTPSIAADIMRVQLPYVRTATITGTGIADYVFRGNSVFDPDFTGVGSQPLGHDQWSALYRRYRVLASKIEIHVHSQDSADGQGMYIVPLNTSAAVLSRTQILEQQGSDYKILALQGAGPSARSMMKYKGTASQRGVPISAVRSDADFSALTTTNPNLEWFWHFGTFDMSSLVDSISAEITIKIVYYVEYFDRQTLSRS